MTENEAIKILKRDLKIKYGSKIIIGDMVVYIDKHFNKFQKKMIKWCFGFEVKDCNGEV